MSGKHLRELEGLGAVERGVRADLADLVRVDLYISLELLPIAREVKAARDGVLARLVGQGVKLTPLRAALAAALACLLGFPPEQC